MRISKSLIFILSIFTPAFYLEGQINCNIETFAFKPAESLTYEVFYHWGLIWANAAEATFSIKKEILRNKPVYHFTGTGSTHKSYDWFFKVRDKFESWTDSATLKPIRYIRNSSEGGNKVYNDNYFNFVTNDALCYKIDNAHVAKDTVSINQCTFDVLSMIYYARCIDYSRYAPDTKIPISLYLDGQLYDKLYIRYLGKEKIKTDLGEINCIKFKPLLIKGTIFSGGEVMTVWVTDDAQKTPVLVKTTIVVGDIQVKIKKISH